MMLEYNNFVNEAKVAELVPGTRVILRGHQIYKPEYGYINIDGLLATVKSKARKILNRVGNYTTMITFTLDEPIITGRKGKAVKPLEEIELAGMGVREIEIIGDDYEETKKRIASGELIKFQATKDIMQIFKEMKFKPKGNYFDISYLDIVRDNTDYISFIPAKKAVGDRHLDDKGFWVNDFEKFRQTTRAGRILRKLNPDLTDKELEELGDKYKATVENHLKEPEINVVNGEDISFWYNEKRYVKGNGSLNNSCMRYDNARIQERVSFYNKFPNQIALATLIKHDEKTGKDKLAARALIWKLDDGRVYMDRIYSVNGSSTVQLEKYANKHGMLLYKYIGKDKYNNKPRLRVTLVSQNSIKIDCPFMDTFKYNGTKVKEDKGTKKLFNEYYFVSNFGTI